MLVDGRNRREACRIAGVEPRYERLPEGVEPVDYIISTNIERRHLTKGQRAMALAILFPEPEKGGRGHHGAAKEAKKLGGFSDERLRQARLILRTAEDLARQVMSGTKPFDLALTESRERQQAELGQEAEMRRLRQDAPDLADLVVEERLTITEATAALYERDRLRRQTIESGRRSAERIATSFAADAIAILSAIEVGEAIELNADQKAQIKQTLKLLSREKVLT